MDSAAATNSYEADVLPRMCAAEAMDRLTVMRAQEQTVYKCDDYLNQARMEGLGVRRSLDADLSPADESKQPVDEECRVKMCEWCYQVVDFCKFRRETVGVGMSYLDRYLCTSSPRARKCLQDRKEYQLAAMTTLYMAIKLFEPLEMETALLSELSRGCYSTTEIAQMEADILMSLNWRVNGPSTVSCIHHFLLLLPNAQTSPVAATLLDCAKFQAELSVGDYFFATQSSSIVALGSILNAMEGIDDHSFSAAERMAFLQQVNEATGINAYAQDILDVRQRLLETFAKSSGYDPNQMVCDETSNTTVPKERAQSCGSPICVSKRKGLVSA